MTDLDTQLLNRRDLSTEEQKRVGRLVKKDKRIKDKEKKSQENKDKAKNKEQDKKQSKLKTTRQQLVDTGKKGVKNKVKQEGADYAKKKVAAPARMYTNHMLRWSWIMLVPSWGLTLIYINLHAFMSLLVPSFFCKIGDEWIPVPIKMASGYQGSRIARIIEKMVLILADIIASIIIFLALLLLILIAYVATESLTAVMNMGSPLLKVLWEMVRMEF